MQTRRDLTNEYCETTVILRRVLVVGGLLFLDGCPPTGITIRVHAYLLAERAVPPTLVVL